MSFVTALLLLFTHTAVVGEVVLLRYSHDDDAHRDDIGCMYEARPVRRQLFSAEKLLERIVLPDALWCDSAGQQCHDATSSRHYVARSLECANGPLNADGVRCRVRIDCTELISSFWLSLAATLSAIVAFILVPGICCDDGRPRRVDYERDTSL